MHNKYGPDAYTYLCKHVPAVGAEHLHRGRAQHKVAFTFFVVFLNDKKLAGLVDALHRLIVIDAVSKEPKVLVYISDKRIYDGPGDSTSKVLQKAPLGEDVTLPTSVLRHTPEESIGLFMRVPHHHHRQPHIFDKSNLHHPAKGSSSPSALVGTRVVQLQHTKGKLFWLEELL
eukprot:6201925-Pleurochrysis_carterae.AAC.2